MTENNGNDGVEVNMAGGRMSLLLFLADGRFPAGGHAHSGGLEEAVTSGRVHDEASLLAFLAGRLLTVGAVDTHLAVAVSRTCIRNAKQGHLWGQLALQRMDTEAAARCPSPNIRAASRVQGRALVRAAAALLGQEAVCLQGEKGLQARILATMGDRAVFAQGPMMPTALGVVGTLFGLPVREVALWAAHAAVSGPAWAATRLLGIDPFAVARCLLSLAPSVEEVASEAVAFPVGQDGTPSLPELPAMSAPLLELGAEVRGDWEVCLFAS